MCVAIHYHAQVAHHYRVEGVLLDGGAGAAAIALEQVGVALKRSGYSEWAMIAALCQITLPNLGIEDSAHLLRQHRRREWLVEKMRARSQLVGVEHRILGVAGYKQHLDTR